MENNKNEKYFKEKSLLNDIEKLLKLLKKEPTGQISEGPPFVSYPMNGFRYCANAEELIDKAVRWYQEYGNNDIQNIQDLYSSLDKEVKQVEMAANDKRNDRVIASMMNKATARIERNIILLRADYEELKDK